MVTCFQVWVYEGVCVVWWRWGDIVCRPVYRYEYTKVCVKCGEGEVTDFLCLCVLGGGGGGGGGKLFRDVAEQTFVLYFT
jgi:hypothetical protein